MADVEGVEVIIEEPVTEEVEEAVEVAEADIDTPEIEEEVGEDVVTFGDDEAPKDDDTVAAPEWVKDLRKKNREQARELAELKKAKADEKPSSLSTKPTLEGANFDEEKYAKQLDDWYVEKRAHDDAEAAKEKEADKQRDAWNSRLGEYNAAKSAFKPDTIEDAEAVARDALSETQQGVLIEALGKSAVPLLVGLAANEERLKSLASIKNPIRFTAEAVRLESIMKTTTKRPRTVPETRVVGSGSGALGDKTLDKLRAEAEKTGDSTKVVAYRKKMREAS